MQNPAFWVFPEAYFLVWKRWLTPWKEWLLVIQWESDQCWKTSINSSFSSSRSTFDFLVTTDILSIQHLFVLIFFLNQLFICLNFIHIKVPFQFPYSQPLQIHHILPKFNKCLKSCLDWFVLGFFIHNYLHVHLFNVTFLFLSTLTIWVLHTSPPFFLLK